MSGRSLASLKKIILMSPDEVDKASQGKPHYEYYWNYMITNTPWLIAIPKFAFDFFNEGSPGDTDNTKGNWDWDFILALLRNYEITQEEIASLVLSFDYDDIVKYLNLYSFSRLAEMLVKR